MPSARPAHPRSAARGDCLADRFGEAAAARIAHQLVEFGAVRAMAYVGIESNHPVHLRVTGPA
ncbi:hypothetical protein ACIQI7_05260 [Kitasatospora sp. NPDC092039]|uniref:hypothetical protein n=1 Tax=Kitasatospora sp. NPDC092039 TaxID=3364086 RepID=UPI003813BBA2